MTKEATTYFDEEVREEENSSEGVKLEDILNSIRGMMSSQHSYDSKSTNDRSEEVENYLEFQEFSQVLKEQQDSDELPSAANARNSEVVEEAAAGDEILELTDIVEPSETKPESKQENKPEKKTSVQADSAQELISENIKQKSAAIISDFSQHVEEAKQPKQSAPANDELETVVHRLMRPLIKQWLDANLPGIVERVVSDEIKNLVPKK